MIVPKGIVNRVFRIQYNNSSGTAFTIEYLSRQYVVTAKHLLGDMVLQGQICNVRILHVGGYDERKVKVHIHDNDFIDIAVLEPIDGKDVGRRDGVGMSMEGMVIADDLLVAGFPLECSDPIPGTDRPMPFFKKATLSAVVTDHNARVVMLDGHNNQGFSGGPVVYKPSRGRGLSICAVVSGYNTADVPVHSRDGIDTGFFIRENAGLMCAFAVIHIEEILRKLD